MPAPSLLLTTELEAVNMILATAGQAPVNTLEVSGIRDVSIARSRLHETSRALQARGWSFNTDPDVSWAPDINGKIAAGPTVLSFTALDRDPALVVQRLDSNTLRVFDAENQTFVFTAPLRVSVVNFLSFESLPQTARDYIAVMAARRFHANNVGDTTTAAYTEDFETALRAEFLRDESRRARTNLFRGPSRTNRIVHRRF
jgi:hypothetical protein